MSKLPETFQEMVLHFSADEYVKQPLWNFEPKWRPLVLAERARRGFITDPEPTGDPDFS